MQRFPILLVGHFLHSSIGHVSISEELGRQLGTRGWSVLTTSSEPNRLKRLADMVTTVLRRRDDYRVAMVFVYSGPAFIWAEAVCAALRLARKPYLLALHGGDLPRFARRWPVRVRTLLCPARAVVSPSRYLSEEMRGYRDDIVIVPNAIDLSIYRFRVRDKPQPRIIWLRALHRIYGPGDAVRVAGLLKGEFPTLRLTMLGPEREAGCAAEIRRLAADVGVSECLELPGAVPKGEIPNWLDQADILINTATVDNTPVSVIEGMAGGLCVVSTNVGGIPYMLSDGENSLLVAPRDPEAMAGAVRRILRTPGLGERLSVNGRKAAGDYDWAAIGRRWDELIARVR